MSRDKKQAKAAMPMIRFGGEWIPAHDLWKKMETANLAVDAIERFNTEFAHLASAETRDVVPAVRHRLKNIDLRIPGRFSQPELTSVALGLLESMTPENTIEVFHDKYHTDIDIPQLILLAGEDAYMAALKREAGECAVNLVSPEQTAKLWNNAGRPTPGGGLWSAEKIGRLLA